MTFTLLNTRPAHQAQELTEKVLAAGGQVLSCPTLEIVGISPDHFNFNDILSFDKVIFISANAVQQFALQLDKLPNSLADKFQKHTSCYAIGKATSMMGEKLNLPLKTLSDSVFDSEHFLAHPSMQVLKGEKVLLVKGVGGRDFLAKTLAEREAVVSEIELYERREKPFCFSVWNEFVNQVNPVLLVTSLASWQVIADALQNQPEPHSMPSSMVTLVMSQRIANHLNQQNWSDNVKVVETQSSDGIIDAIQQMHF